MKSLSKREIKQLITALVFLIAALVTYLQPKIIKDGLETAQKSQPGLYEVEEVSDGDTIIVNMNGIREIIRLIGVDTPETQHPDRPLECYAAQASEYTRRLLTGQKVRLQVDPLNTNRDRYDRLLRYVFTQDGRLVEQELITEGYGFSYTQFPFERKREFNEYEQQAKEGKKGLWGVCQVTISESGLERTNPAM
ncbi:thermonuclease family protein [Candidatus Saccharibacteria bacterium]|nr:thermonuclease family protein [Candidatus Saccharibacteria bacterium]